jgi:hypothetical protein
MCTVRVSVHQESCDIRYMEKFTLLYDDGGEDLYLDFFFFFPRILYLWIHAINLHGV